MKTAKKSFVTALAFGALFLYNSCNIDKLDLTNPNELTSETYFKTSAQVQSAVDAVYGNLQTTSLYSLNMYWANDGSSHEVTCNCCIIAPFRQYCNFSVTASHVYIEGLWASCYMGINKANFVINNAEAIQAIPDAQLSQINKDKYIGEAFFLRALYYFILVEKFGDIPIYLDVTADGEGTARRPVAEVYTLIEADLTTAAATLLTKATEPQHGRATQGAAWALLGKVRLYQKNYQGALNAFDHVTGYSLEPAYFDNFTEENENGIESIFEVQYSVEAGSANHWDSDRTDEGLNETTFRGQEYGFANWFNVYISEDLWNEFETAADNGVKDDPRRGYSFYQNGDHYGVGGHLTVDIPPITWVSEDTIIRRAWRKYQNYYKDDTEGEVVSYVSGINMKIIRYADVILMQAECEANREGGSLTAAIDLMNLIRERADVDLPLYGTAAMDAIFPVTTPAQFMVALEHERKVELCGEQVRFPDLVRWHRLTDFMNEVWPSLPPYDQDNLVFDFTSDKNYLWPIPQREIDMNINIDQEDQNPGYE